MTSIDRQNHSVFYEYHSTYAKNTRKQKKGKDEYTTYFLLLERDMRKNFHILLHICLYCMNYFVNYTACIILSQAMIFKIFLFTSQKKDWDLFVPGINLMEPILEYSTSITFNLFK